MPTEFKDMVVYASDPHHTQTLDTRIRNFKFKTEQDDGADWEVVDGADCYNECGKGGACTFCGSNGFCCSTQKLEDNGDCTTEMLQAIKTWIFWEQNHHMCVVMLPENSCSDFNLMRETDCPGQDLKEYQAPLGVQQCQDICMANQPACKGFTYSNPHFSRPNLCWLKHTVPNCNAKSNLISGILFHYKCNDNNDCGGSFVKFEDLVPETSIARKKTYCGMDRPPEFSSASSSASIEIQIESATVLSGTPEFKPKFK